MNDLQLNADRFIAIALSQGGLQAVLKAELGLIISYIEEFQKNIRSIFNEGNFEIDFCYRMRIGVK